MNTLKRGTSTVLAAAASALIIYYTARGALGTAGDLATVVATLVLLLAYLVGLFTPRPAPQDFSAIHDQLADQVAGTLGKAASDQLAEQSHFLPPRLVSLDSGQPVLPGTGAGAWKAKQYQDALVDAISRDGPCRTVIIGPSGVGKTTLGLMLALGLCRHRQGIPLLLRLGTWNPEAERFVSWFDRQLTSNYRAIAAMGDDRMNQLLYSDSSDILIILDGLDELGEVETGSAIAQINEVIPVKCPLVVLARPMRSARFSELTDSDPSAVLLLAAPDVRTVERYLYLLVHEDKVVHRDKALSAWADAAREVREDQLSRVAEVLRSPLLLDMALRTYRTRAEVRAYLSVIRESGGERARELLFREYLHQRFRQAGRDPEEAVRRLVYIAGVMRALQTRSICWWRVSDEVPGWVLAVAATMSLGPAYWLSQLMPVGLTRGLAVGCFAGILIGLTRSRSIRSGAWQCGLVAALIVGAIGTVWVGAAIAAADVAEISVAVAAFVLLKNEMLDPQPTLMHWFAGRVGAVALARWPTFVPRAERLERGGRALLAMVANGVAAASATEFLHACWPSAPSRPFGSVCTAIAFAVVVAVMSARLLIPVSAPVRPSRVILRSRGSRLGNWMPHVSAGIASAVAVGVAGGVVGSFHAGVHYGLSLTLFFGVVAGVPIGITGGVIRWLNQPVIRRVVASPRYTFRSDWFATAGCMALVSLSSAASIALLLGPLRFLVAYLGLAVLVTPPDGLLFGLTIGAVVACYYNAAPGFTVAALYFGLSGRLPWRLMRYFAELHRLGILYSAAACYHFRHDELRTWLARQDDSEPRRHLG